jgi:hypothetical protein
VLAHERPRLARDDLPPELGDIIACALSRERDERYASAARMQVELERLVPTLGVPATDSTVAAWMREVRSLALEASAEEMAKTSDNLTVGPRRGR